MLDKQRYEYFLDEVNRLVGAKRNTSDVAKITGLKPGYVGTLLGCAMRNKAVSRVGTGFYVIHRRVKLEDLRPVVTGSKAGKPAIADYHKGNGKSRKQERSAPQVALPIEVPAVGADKFVIEDGVPMPFGRKGAGNYAAEALVRVKPGQSFLIPTDRVKAIYSSVSRLKKAHILPAEFRYTTRVTEDGKHYRFWRTE